ncbi:MAG: hypothetical protein LBL44_09345 [Treponema sp.]|nr:hypothetical protein [Treponema sp.]
MKNLFMKNLHKGGSVVCLCCAVLFPAASLSAQTAAELERLLDTREITRAGAAYFTLGAVMDGPPNPPAAFALALKQGWLSGSAGPGASVTLRDLSLLMMKAFNLEGGLMYRIFPGPRYAYREMIRQGFIEGRAYPLLTVSGERFLHILGNVLSHAGDAEGPETARRPLPGEAARDSPRDNAGGHRGLSAGPEGVRGYEGEFEPE